MTWLGCLALKVGASLFHPHKNHHLPSVPKMQQAVTVEHISAIKLYLYVEPNEQFYIHICISDLPFPRI
jgi:hypothetical protein